MAYLLARSLTFVPAPETVLSANRFVMPRTSDGTIDYPALGGAAGYITLDSSEAGSVAGIACGLMDGAGLEVEVGGPVANGARVTTDGQGRAIASDSTAYFHLGIAQQAATAAGEVITIVTPSLHSGDRPDVLVPIAGVLAAQRLVTRQAAGMGPTAASPFGSTHVTLAASPLANQDPIPFARLNGSPVQVSAGGAVVIGNYVSSSNDGQAVVAGSGTSVSGVALSAAAAADDVITILGVAFGYRVA